MQGKFADGGSSLVEDKTREWLEIADDDFAMSHAALRAKRFLHVMVFCQQAVEKTIKGLYFEFKRKTPPYKHDLLALANDTGFIEECSPEQLVFLAELSQYYVGARYPDKRKELADRLTRDKARLALKKTEEMLQWLRGKLN